MDHLAAGGIDCDVHPALPGMAALLPYLEPYWREQITVRGQLLLCAEINAPAASDLEVLRAQLARRSDHPLPGGASRCHRPNRCNPKTERDLGYAGRG